MPRGALLVRVPDAEERVLLERTPRDLDAQRQAALREPARHRHRRNTGEVERAPVRADAEELRDDRLLRRQPRLRRDGRRASRLRGRHDDVVPAELAHDMAAHKRAEAQQLRVHRAGNETRGHQPAPRRKVVLLRLRAQPLPVRVRSLNVRQRVRDESAALEERQRRVGDARPRILQHPHRGFQGCGRLGARHAVVDALAHDPDTQPA